MRLRLAVMLLLSWPGMALAELCTASTLPVAFGNYRPFDTLPAGGSGTVTVTCGATLSLLVFYTISLSAGNSGSYGSRTLLSGSAPLSYQLYTDLLMTKVWGDGTGGSGTVTDGYLLQALVNIVKPYPVTGLIAARQNAAPGAYVDSITVTVTY